MKISPTLRTIARAAVVSERATGFPAAVTVAQCGIESSWLTKMSGKSNAFGIKELGFGPSSPVVTHEWFTAAQLAAFLAGNPRRTAVATGRRKFNLREYKCLDFFRDYPELSDSFADHARLVTQGLPYREAWADYKSTGDREKLIDRIAARYATSPAYAALIKTIAGYTNVAQAIIDARKSPVL